MSVLKLIFLNLRRSWFRNLLLMLSILVAYLLFGVLMAFERAYGNSSEVGDGRIVTTNKISFSQPLPISHFHTAKNVAGVQEASFAAWFGGFYREPRNRLHTIAVEPESYLRVYGEDLVLSAEERSNFLGQRDSVLVGASMAEKFGWKVGDRIPLLNRQIPRSDGSESWNFRIAGLVRGATAYVDTSFLYIHYDLFNEARSEDKDSIGWIVVKPDSEADPGALGEDIDRLFDTSADRTTTDTERSFAQTFVAQFGDLALVTLLILGAAFFSLLIIVGSTTALAIRQRIREVGILKGIGFSHSRILSLFIGESLLVVASAGIVGLILAAYLVRQSSEALTSIAPGMAVTGSIIVIGVVSMVLLALFSSALPSWRAVSQNASSILRRG
ncbi:MAG: FtsX-like permease family protein [Verrucomicrobiota bacterium]